MKMKNILAEMNNKKRVRLFAAALLTVALTGSQMIPTFASQEEEMAETDYVIPENITIEYPVPLAEVQLPASDQGTMMWVDDSFIPSARVQSCDIKFIPNNPEEFEDQDGWNAEEGALYDTVTVVVSSIQEEEPDVSVTPSVTVTPSATVTPEPSVSPAPETDEEGLPDEEKEEIEESGDLGSDESIQKEEESETVPDSEENTDSEDNIFDQPEDNFIEDDRPTDLEENLTEEEMLTRAQENHNCNGISVSGVNLPWYVQFRVSSGEAYQFTNAEDANIFQSYEFELWDLQNNKEYAVPEGEYVSVTVPVKEGYEYTIEHLLDNGAMETIIPSVEGGTMIFSTSSFSPFGIAGSKPLVGEDITDGNYGSGDTASGAEGTEGENVTTITKTPAASSGTEEQEAGSSQVKNETQKSTGETAQNQKNVSSKAVNTGDDTQILPFVILFVAAVVVIVGIVVFLKKRK